MSIKEGRIEGREEDALVTKELITEQVVVR
jgi:hypothetical protein